MMSFAPLLLLALAGLAPAEGAVVEPPPHPWIDVTPRRPSGREPGHDGGQGLQAASCSARSVGIRGEGPPAPRAGPFTVNATWGAGVTPARQVVIQQAINEWQGVIQESGSTPGSYPITISFSSFGGGNVALASTTTSYFVSTGNLASAVMGFNTDYTWFVDPSPADDSEFTGPSPPAGYDLLTVARHELGHAVGWINESIRISSRLVGAAYDPPRLNIPTVSATGLHVDPAWLADDLMVPSIGPSTRRPISLYPAASLVARAYEYGIPMRFVDPSHVGPSNGTANQPYAFFTTAAVSDPFIPILAANLTFHVPAGVQLAQPKTWYAARGGAVIVAP